jgi:hypothetical protein
MVIHGAREALVASGEFPELLTAEQVSALLGVSVATLNRWAAVREQPDDKSARPAIRCPSVCAAGTPPRSANGSNR